MFIIMYLFVIAIILFMLHLSNCNVKHIERMGSKSKFHQYVVSGQYKRDRENQKAELLKKKNR